MNNLIRRTARLREAGPHGVGRRSRLMRRPPLFLVGSNAVLNPSFETNLLLWDFAKTAERVAGGVDGAWSAEIAAADTTGDSTSGFNIQGPPEPSEGEVWSARIWVRAGSGTPDIRMRFWDAGFTEPEDFALTPTGEARGGWLAYQYLGAVAPADAAFLYLHGWNQHATETLQIDAASLVQVG